MVITTVLAAGMGAGCYWLIVGDQGSRESLSVPIGWLGLVFFSIAILASWGQFLSSPRPTLTIAPSGVTDVRISGDEIPWSAVQSVELVEMASNKWVMLQLIPAAEQQLRLTRIAKRIRGPNKRLGFDGLAIDTMNLAWRHKVVFALLASYAQTYAGVEVGNGPSAPK